MKTTTKLFAALCTLIVASPSFAEDSKFNLTELTCFEVISQSEDDALFLTALLIGFKTGMDGSAEMSSDAIKASVEAMDTTCGENPDMMALDALS